MEQPKYSDKLLFTIIPDVISRWPLPRVNLFLYFFSIFIWGLTTTTYKLTSIVMAFCEEYPSLLKWRLLFILLFCSFLGVVNAIFLRPQFIKLFSYSTSHFFVYVRATQLLVSIIGLFVYSLERFKNDYQFKYGTILNNYWMVGPKIALLVLSILCFLIYSIEIKNVSISDIFIGAALLSPIIIGMVITTMKYSVKILPTLLDPSPKWGPKNRKKKLARSRFDPTHELHYRSTTQTCQHNCLLGSPALKKEIKYWGNKRLSRASQLPIDDSAIMQK